MPKYKGTVTRSVTLLDKNAYDGFLKMLGNGEVSFEQYISTTSSKKFYDPNANVQIKILNTTSGADIRKYSGEEEILFKRNSVFKVLEYRKIKGTTWVLLEKL